MNPRLAVITGICFTAVGCTGLPIIGAPATVAQPVQAVQPRSNAQVLNVLADVEAMKAELRQLRDKVERQEFELEKMRSRQTQLYADLDQRLRVREQAGLLAGSGPVGSAVNTASVSSINTTPTFSNVNTAVGALPPTAQGTTGSASGTETAGQIIMPAAVGSNSSIVTQPATLTSRATTTTIDSSTGQVVNSQVATIQPSTTLQSNTTLQPNTTQSLTLGGSGPVTISAQNAYDQAFGLLKQSRYSDAVAAFETFVQTYPVNDLTDDAFYWMAEARYVTREFESALSGYQTVTASFPESQRIPSSFLKIGYIQYEVGNYVDARETLSFILKNFPTHRVAVSAETRLKKMDREGR